MQSLRKKPIVPLSRNPVPFSLNKKEWRQIILLLFLFMMITVFFFMAKSSVSQGIIQSNEWEKLYRPVDLALLKLPDYKDDPNILLQVQDDTYLEVEGFGYLLRKMFFVSESELQGQCDPNFQWDSLEDVSKRSEYRGKVSKLKGSMVDLQLREISQDLADLLKIPKLLYWQGLILDDQARAYSIIFNEFPKGLQKFQTVEVYGTFFKIWKYPTQKPGSVAISPVYFAKTFHPIELKKNQLEIYEMSWTTAIFFVIIFSIIIVAVISDHIHSQNRRKKRNCNSKPQSFLF